MQVKLREFCESCGVACDTASETLTIRIDEYGNSKVFNLCPNCLKGFLKQQAEAELNFVKNSKWGIENRYIDYGEFQRVAIDNVSYYVCPKCHGRTLSSNFVSDFTCKKCNYKRKKNFRMGEKYKNIKNLAIIEVTNIKDSKVYYKVVKGNESGKCFHVDSVFATELELFEEKEKQNE